MTKAKKLDWRDYPPGTRIYSPSRTSFTLRLPEGGWVTCANLTHDKVVMYEGMLITTPDGSAEPERTNAEMHKMLDKEF